MKLATKKKRLHKKLRVSSTEPGSLIREVNARKSAKGLPAPHTELGVAWRGLI